MLLFGSGLLRFGGRGLLYRFTAGRLRFVDICFEGAERIEQHAGSHKGSGSAYANQCERGGFLLLHLNKFIQRAALIGYSQGNAAEGVQPFGCAAESLAIIPLQSLVQALQQYDVIAAQQVFVAREQLACRRSG